MFTVCEWPKRRSEVEPLWLFSWDYCLRCWMSEIPTSVNWDQRSHLWLIHFSSWSHSRQLLLLSFHRGNHLWKSLPTLPSATIPPLVLVLHKIKPEHYNKEAEEEDDLNNRCYDWQTTTHTFTIVSAEAAGNKEKNVSSKQHQYSTSSVSTIHIDQHREHWYSTSRSCRWLLQRTWSQEECQIKGNQISIP